MSALDLEAIHGRACALRNIIPGHGDGEDPYVVHAYELEDGDDCRTIEHDAHDRDDFPIESRVYVADHCLMATVPTCEGALMHDTADAIAKAGADMLALIVRDKGRQKECRVYRHTIRLLLEENAALKGESVEVPAEPEPALQPLDDDERERLAHLTEEQSINKLANHAMGAEKLFELIDLRERAGIS